ncbi:MAG: hypothetical protein ACRC9R_10790, partial [Enterovibrio sp.]
SHISHKPKFKTEGSDEVDETAPKHKKCTQKLKHINKQKEQHLKLESSSSEDSFSDEDDTAHLVKKKEKKRSSPSFLQKSRVKLMGDGKVKYKPLATSSSSGSSSESSSDDSDDESSSNQGPSFAKKAAVFLGGLALGAGGVIATMRGGGAAAAALGGFLGMSFATNSESTVEGSDNTVVGGGSNGLFSYNYIWRPPNPELINALDENNRVLCMKMGMIFKNPTDSSWYGWDTQHNEPGCLMTIPKEMVQGYCRTLLVEDNKNEGESSQSQANPKTKLKRDANENKDQKTQKMLDKLRGKDANKEDKEKGKDWLKKSKRR